MVTYLGLGKRSYFHNGVAPFARGVWEVAFIQDNNTILTTPKRNYYNLRGTLFIFPPDCSHGWSAEQDKPSERAILHVTSLPYELTKRIQTSAKKWMEYPLTKEEQAHFLQAVMTIQKDYYEPDSLSMLRFERLTIEIALLALEKSPHKESPENTYEYLCDKVLAWYEEHLSEIVGVQEAARAHNISQAQLRRVFHQVRGESPKKAFTNIQIDKSKDLLFTSDMQIDEISLQCGFSNPASFWRFFKKATCLPPQEWREKARNKEGLYS